jgi:hypothetical protein
MREGTVIWASREGSQMRESLTEMTALKMTRGRRYGSLSRALADGEKVVVE